MSYMCSFCHTEFDVADNIPLDAVFYDIDFDESFLLCYNCAANMPTYFEYDEEEYEPYVDDNDLNYFADITYDDYNYLIYAN